ncbi:MAG: hypothetical protein HKN73_14545 [Gemmatimonadetes bacterium]|nr:hypothetical protein [Gemmatimonadota bacterium]
MGWKRGRGRAVAGALLLSLTGVASSEASAQEKKSVEVPLRLEAGRLIVQVEAGDGEAMDFMVTNGQGLTLLSQSLVDRLGPAPELTLGGIEVPTEGSVVVPDERFREDGVSFEGIVGANTLNRFDALFDVPGGRLVLKEVSGAVQWPGVALSDPMSIQVYHGVALAMDAEVNGTSYRASLDLGRKVSVANQGLAQAEGLGSGGGVQLRVAGVDRAAHPVEVRELDIFQRWSPDGEPFLLMGIPLVEDCALSISWAHQELRTCSP